MGDLAWGRNYRLAVGPAGQTGREWSRNEITFEVNQDCDEEPNQSKFSLYNLSAEERAYVAGLEIQPGQAIDQTPQVIFSVGYGGDTTLLFKGDLVQVYHEKKGLDWVTHVEAGDGEVAYRDGHITLSRAPGATRRQALERVAEELGLGLYVPAVGGPDPLDAPYTNGMAFHGPAQNLIRQLSRGSGRSWSIQHKVLQLITEGGATELPAVLLSAATGLIGNLEAAKSKVELIGPDRRRRRRDDREEEPGVNFESLLNPKIQPGQLVRVVDTVVQGTFVVRKVRHSGDYRNNTWKSSGELGSVSR